MNRPDPAGVGQPQQQERAATATPSEVARDDLAVAASVICPHGTRLASGSDDRTIRLWQVLTGEPAAAWELDDQVRAVAFGMGDRLDELMAAGGECCLAFTPRVNEWKGFRSVEIEVVDLTPGGQPCFG